MPVDYRIWQLVPLGDTERSLLETIYAAWRGGQPLDRERALFSVVRRGIEPHEAAEVENRVVNANDPALVRDRGGGALVPTLAGAIALLPSVLAREDLANLQGLIAFLHQSYNPDLRSIPIESIAATIGYEDKQVARLAELAQLGRTDNGIAITQEALFWSPYEAFLQRKIHARQRAPHRPPGLPITATVLQVRWSGLGPFRAAATLDLGPITVLVGANGVGKTSVLAALDTLRAIAHEGLPGVEVHRERIPADIDDLDLGIVAELERPGSAEREIIDWQLVAGLRGRLHARSEILQRVGPAGRTGELATFDRGTGRWSDAAGRLVERTMRPDQLALTTATSPEAHSPLIAIREHLMSWRIELATRRGHPSAIGGADEESAVRALWSSYARDPSALDRLRDHARHVTGIRDLVGHAHGLVIEDSSGARVPQAVASTGVVRVIEILSWLLAPEPPTMLAIDEIEQHLHGDLMARLIDVMRSVSHRTRIVLTTHSARVLRCVSPAEVRLIRRDARGSSIVAVDRDPRLRRLAAAGDLGDLIQDGYFAGGL